MSLNRSQRLRDAMELAASDPPQALARLERAIEEAELLGDWAALAMFARHAGAIAEGNGQNARARAYLERAVLAEPNDAGTHCALMHVLLDIGEIDAAGRALAEVEAIGSSAADPELAELIQAARRVFDDRTREE